jgi:diazepam-binding inhibitor (GABA receptor modulating acyl-CoA-binding protein)
MDKITFEEVLEKLKTLNLDDYNLPDNVKLEFYKYYKQATEGDCNKERPWAINFKECSKWDAWKSVEGMSQEEAKNNYIDCYNSYLSL